MKYVGVMKSGKCTGATLAEPKRASHLFMRSCEIETAVELRSFYINKRVELKERISAGKKVTSWERKISKLNNNTLNSFFAPIP